MVLLATALNAGDFHLEDGDRVLFYGETEPAERLFTAFVETYALTRFPYRTVTFLHGGWGGEAASSYSPTVVVLLLGLDKTPCGDAELCRWGASGARWWICGGMRRGRASRPSGPRRARMRAWPAFLKELGGAVDLDTPLAAAVAKARETDRRLAEAIAPDPFRPGPAGHLLLAQFLLAAWRAPALVSRLRRTPSTRSSAARKTWTRGSS